MKADVDQVQNTYWDQQLGLSWPPISLIWGEIVQRMGVKDSPNLNGFQSMEVRNKAVTKWVGRWGATGTDAVQAVAPTTPGALQHQQAHGYAIHKQ